MADVKKQVFNKKNKKEQNIKSRLDNRKKLIVDHNLPTSKRGCVKCDSLSVKICGDLFGKFSDMRLSILPDAVQKEISDLKKVFLEEVTKIRCIDQMHKGQLISDSNKYIVCDKHWEESLFMITRILLKKAPTHRQFSREDDTFRDTIKMKCQECLNLRENLDVNTKRAAFKVHTNQVMKCTLKLDALVCTVQEREATCAQERKAKNIEEHNKQKGTGEKKKNDLIKRDLTDNVARMDYDQQEIKEIDWVFYHRGRATTKYPDSTHSSARDTVINSIKAQLDDGVKHFELKPKILGDKKNKKDSDMKVFCMKCPCPNKDDTKCDRMVCIDTIFRRLTTLPPTISNNKDVKDLKIKMQRDKKKEYLRELGQLKVRIDQIEFKLRRDDCLILAKLKDPQVIICLYCDIGLAYPFKGDDKDLLVLEDFHKEQNHIRKCDTCQTVFCKNMFNMGNGEITCGHKYFIGESYVNYEEKNDDPRVDHRKMTCLEVHTVNADPSLKLIGQTSRVCPHCNMAAQRVDGCNSMGCRCGKYFCWLCGEGTHTDPTTGVKTIMNNCNICHKHVANCSGAKGDWFHNTAKVRAR